MGTVACDDEQFIAIYRQHGPTETSRILKVNERGVLSRRARLEQRLRIKIEGPGVRKRAETTDFPHRATIDIVDGIVLIGGDCHYWPGTPSTAHRAFVQFCKELRPAAVIMNGDVIDACSISRHLPIGWEQRPTVQQEIEAAQERLGEIEKATPRRCKLIWNLGNHDSRFEMRLATVAPEFAKVHGVHLKDHFPSWSAAWSAWVNSDVVVKHRFKGGIHAPHNNTMWAGKTVITGHLHSAKVVPFTDYNGTRYGVDTGCLADPDGPQFIDYTEDNPKNWRSAFGVLTFHRGELLYPELVFVHSPETVQWRGEVLKV